MQLVTCSWRLNYNYLCQPVTYSTHPDEMRVGSQHEIQIIIREQNTQQQESKITKEVKYIKK